MARTRFERKLHEDKRVKKARVRELGKVFQRLVERGQPSGYPSLDADGLVPTDQLGTGTADNTTYLRGDQTWQTVSSGSGDVVGPASATDGNLVVFDGTTGKLVKDGGAPSAGGGDVTGPGSATNNAIAFFSGTTGKVIKDLAAVPSATPAADTIPIADGSGKLDAWVTPVEAFPVGAVFIAVVSTDPATLLGYGTWSAIAAGRVLVGLDSGDSDFNTVEETGGAKTVTSTGTISAIAATATAAGRVGTGAATVAQQTHTHAAPTYTGNATSVVQPYFVVYMWKRTA